MSYLSQPRFHFKCIYSAKPSTINNLPTNYGDLLPAPPAPTTRGSAFSWPRRYVWSPNGNAYWLLSDGSITSVVSDDSPTDTLEGAPVAATDDWGGSGVPAKIVDLDPQQQMVSMIYGMQLKIGSGEDSVTGDFRPVWFQDLWGQGTNGPAGAVFESRLENLQWGSNLQSSVLLQLQQMSPDALSIHLVTDLPSLVSDSNNAKSPMNVMTGRVVGTVGPGSLTCPYNFVPGRLLRPVVPGFSSIVNYSQAVVDGDRLTVDLGNSIPWQAAGNQPPNLGTLGVFVGGQKGMPVTLIGEIDYSAATYEHTGLVKDFTLSEIGMVDDTPLYVAEVVNGMPGTVYLQENPSGVYINATPYVFRLQAGGSAQCTLMATKFGNPLPDLEIALADQSGPLGPTPPAVGTPPDALSYPASVKTGADGSVTFTLQAGDPGSRTFRGTTQTLDGQVYGVGWSSPEDTNPDPNAFLSVLVHDGWANGGTTWADIQPIMEQYASLYPFMNQNFFQLDEKTALQQNAARIIEYLNFPKEDPRHMPVVRDLSDVKRKALIDWLQSGTA